MKKILLALLAAGLTAMVYAQTGLLSSGPAGRDIGVHSAHAYFDGKTQQLVYSDDVCVTNARGQMRCERLTFNFPPENAVDHHPTNAVAESKLVLLFFTTKGQTNRLAADKGVYDHNVVDDSTNEIFTFTGDTVRLSGPQGWLTCKRLTLYLPPIGAADNHPTNAVAETNVVAVYVDKQHETNYLTADKAIYNYGVVAGITNETFTFTGHATNTTANGWATGEPLIYDVANDRFEITDNVEIHYRMRHAAGATTNSPVNFLK